MGEDATHKFTNMRCLKSAAMVAKVLCNLTPRHPPSQVLNLDNPCLTHNLGQIIYYFIFGVLGACRQAPYKFKKSYGGGSVWGLPIVSILGTVKPTIFAKIGGSGTCKFF
jgi:hypothetical protein